MPPEVTIDPSWSSVLLAYGPLGVFAAVVLYFVIRYGGRVLEGHISFMDTAKDTQSRLTVAVETLTERDGSDRTRKALGHAFNAAKESTTCPDVNKHLDKALDALGQ